MSIQNVRKFYDLTFLREEIQAELIDKDLADFVQTSLKIAGELNLEFTEEEFRDTMKGIPSNNSNETIDFGSKWINKIMSIGWTPKGYSR